MNCCDEYGMCRQGRDCPARRSVLDEGKSGLRFVAILIGAGLVMALVAFVMGLSVGVAMWLVEVSA